MVSEDAVPFRRGTSGSNPSSSSGESGEIHERACGAEVWTHPVHRKPAMKLVHAPASSASTGSAPGDPVRMKLSAATSEANTPGSVLPLVLDDDHVLALA